MLGIQTNMPQTMTGFPKKINKLVKKYKCGFISMDQPIYNNIIF